MCTGDSVVCFQVIPVLVQQFVTYGPSGKRSITHLGAFSKKRVHAYVQLRRARYGGDYVSTGGVDA